MTKGIIGIVGGMGPLSGVDMASMVIAQTKAKTDQEHVPMILFSLAPEIADRTQYILGEQPHNPGQAIASQLLEMENLGVHVAALACNSAHAPAIYDPIIKKLKEAKARIRLLHIVDEVAVFIRKYHPKVKKVGVLGTSGTFRSQLYSRIERKGLQCVNVTAHEQERLHAAIYHPDYGIKSTGAKVSREARTILLETCQSLKKRSAEILVFGCTELSLAHRAPEADGLPVVDATMVLARALSMPWRPKSYFHGQANMHTPS